MLVHGLIAGVALLATGACGAASDEAGQAGDTTTAVPRTGPGIEGGSVVGRLDGSWTVDTVKFIDDSRIDTPQPDTPRIDPAAEALVGVTINFDTGASSVDFSVGCRLVLGSYTFLPDGTAGFTLPGRSTVVCPAAEEEAAATLTSLLEQTLSWRPDGQLLVFEGPRGQVSLRRAD